MLIAHECVGPHLNMCMFCFFHTITVYAVAYKLAYTIRAKQIMGIICRCAAVEKKQI